MIDTQSIDKNKALRRAELTKLMRSINDWRNNTEAALKKFERYEQNENYGKY